MGLSQTAQTLQTLLQRRKVEKKSPAAQALSELGIGQDVQGEELVKTLTESFRGHCIQVFQAILNVVVDFDNFYTLQAQAMHTNVPTEMLQGYGEAEKMVRALLIMAANSEK